MIPERRETNEISPELLQLSAWRHIMGCCIGWVNPSRSCAKEIETLVTEAEEARICGAEYQNTQKESSRNLHRGPLEC